MLLRQASTLLVAAVVVVAVAGLVTVGPRWSSWLLVWRSISRYRRSVPIRLQAEPGSIVPLLAIVLFVMMAAAMVVVAVAGRAANVARAQWAADATALAVVAVGHNGTVRDGPGIAAGRSLAEANGAVLIDVVVHVSPPGLIDPNFSRGGTIAISPIVVVEVERDGIKARAAAARFSAPPP